MEVYLENKVQTEKEDIAHTSLPTWLMLTYASVAGLSHLCHPYFREEV
jgi:hypothetical protein